MHTARVIDVDALPNGLPYMVMEYLEGRTLDLELEAHGPMPIESAVDIVTQVAEAMTEAHALGIVHRDLKPANLFVCRACDRPVIKVLDFGISEAEEDGARVTGNDEWFGTPSYAALEQVRGEADARSDVWSLGVVLFELLIGRPPFIGSPMSVLAQVMTAPIPWPCDLRADVPRKLAGHMMHALERDCARRFQSMKEFAAAIAPFGPERRASVLLADLQRSRGRLGEILVSEGILSAEDLERAVAAQRTDGRLLGRVLLDMGLVAHADLLTALAKQQGLSAAAEVRIHHKAQWPDRDGRYAPTVPPTRRQRDEARDEPSTPPLRASKAAGGHSSRPTRVALFILLSLLATGVVAETWLGKHGWAAVSSHSSVQRWTTR